MDKTQYDSKQGRIDRQTYAEEHDLTQFDLDEWDNVCEVLRWDAPFDAVHLLNKYVDKYNETFGTDYDWDWMSYDATEGNRAVLGAILAFARVKEAAKHG